MGNRPPENNSNSKAEALASSGQLASDQQDGAKETPQEFDEFSMPQPPSAVALKLKKLKSASFKAAQARERLPQPLFWSLFLTEVSELKKKKEEKRLLDRILLGVGTE